MKQNEYIQYLSNFWDNGIKEKEHKKYICIATGLTAGLCSFLLIYKQIHKHKYKKLCLEMAKIDHDIAVYNIESANLYCCDKPMKVPTPKKDIPYRCRVFMQMNKGKSFEQLNQEISELKVRRIKDSHVFNFDLMEIRKASQE